MAGDELLAATEYHEDAKLYVRIMTRLRQHEQAYATLQQGLSAAAATVPVVEEQVAKEGIAAITDKEWREQRLKTRVWNAQTGMRGGMSEMGVVVARLFTPEEKVSFGALRKRCAPHELSGCQPLCIHVGAECRLADLEARWRNDAMMHAPERPEVLLRQMVRPWSCNEAASLLNLSAI